MPQLKKLFTSLSWKQRISILVVALLMGAGLVSLTRWRRESDFKPLFQGLSPEDAAAMVTRLKESGTEYRVSENGGILSVPSARVAEVRLEMAAGGLPHTGRLGFELFDQTNFGATEFVEHINYRRALEGELERSVQSLAEVERARVHITFPKDSVFLESREPAKASVMVKLRPGAHLSPPNVMAVTHLVGSAVEGLSPDAVSVLDMQGNLLNRIRKPGDDETSEGMLDFRRRVEKDLLAKIDNTLEPLLGEGRFRTGVTVDCDFTSGEQSEESFDPTKSVMATSEKTEETGGPSQAAGVPGTASNLPRPASRPATSQASFMRRSENVTYQTSRSIKKLKLPQGTVKRVSISILLDQQARWEKQGKEMKLVLQAPTPEMLKSVRDIVAGMAGFDQQRGDQIIVESLPFETTRNQPPPEAQPTSAPAPGKPLDMLKQNPKLLAIGGGVLLAVVVAVGALLFFLRKRGAKEIAAAGGKVQVKAQAALPPGADAGAVEGSHVGDDAKRELENKLSERAAMQAQMEAQVLNAIKVPPISTKKAEVLVKEIRENVKRDAATSAHVLRTLIGQDNK